MRFKITFLLLLLLPTFLMAQTINVEGTVTSATDRNPLPGVTIKIIGTDNIAITDINGHYRISSHKAGTLEFASIGCKTVTRSFNGSATIDIVLEDDANVLYPSNSEIVLTTDYLK